MLGQGTGEVGIAYAIRYTPYLVLISHYAHVLVKQLESKGLILYMYSLLSSPYDP